MNNNDNVEKMNEKDINSRIESLKLELSELENLKDKIDDDRNKFKEDIFNNQDKLNPKKNIPKNIKSILKLNLVWFFLNLLLLPSLLTLNIPSIVLGVKSIRYASKSDTNKTNLKMIVFGSLIIIAAILFNIFAILFILCLVMPFFNVVIIDLVKDTSLAYSLNSCFFSFLIIHVLLLFLFLRVVSKEIKRLSENALKSNDDNLLNNDLNSNNDFDS